MAIVYLAVRYGGEYDDAWENCLVGSLDKVIIEDYIKNEKIKDSQRKEIIERIYTKRKEYIANNPIPAHPKYPEIIRWAPGLGKKDITPEMKDEREAAMAEQRRINQEYQNIILDWHNNWFEEKRQVLFDAQIELDFEVNLDPSNYPEYPENDVYYRIDEVKLI